MKHRLRFSRKSRHVLARLHKNATHLMRWWRRAKNVIHCAKAFKCDTNITAGDVCDISVVICQ